MAIVHATISWLTCGRSEFMGSASIPIAVSSLAMSIVSAGRKDECECVSVCEYV